jgi:hypothetical protein
MIFLGIESTQMMFSDLNVSFWRLLLSANPVFNKPSSRGGKAVHGMNKHHYSSSVVNI